MTIELEKAVLSCAYLDDKGEKVKIDDLKREMFPNMESWYDQIIKYRKAEKPADYIVAKDYINSSTLKEIVTFTGTLTSYDFYLQELKKAHYIRELYDKMTTQGLNKQDLSKGVGIFTDKKDEKNTYDLNNDLQGYVEELENRMTGNIDWYDWGVNFLDRELGKLRMGKMFVLKAYRKMGKTTFATMVFNSLLQQKIPCLFITTEMGYYEIIDKLVALNTKLNSHLIQNGRIEETEKEKILKALQEKISYKPGQITVCLNLTMEYLKNKIDEMKAKVIIVDYLQMLSITEIPRGMNQTQMREEMATKMKNLCLEKNISLIGLSQVNIDGDTKGCKAFEEKADTILHLAERDKGTEGYVTKELMLHITNRNGNSGSLPIIYFKQYGNFEQEVT